MIVEFEEWMKKIISGMDDNELVRELQFLESVFQITDFPELAMIDEINAYEIVLKDRVAKRFMELIQQQQQ